MSEFKREDRYIVVKLKHLAGLQVAPLRNFLRENRVPQIECVVVEHDWPEYQLVWAMIEHRMAGKPVPDFNLWRRADALQALLTAADERADTATSLIQRIVANFDTEIEFHEDVEPNDLEHDQVLAEMRVFLDALKPAEGGGDE